MKKEDRVKFVDDRLQTVKEDKRLREPDLNFNFAYYMGDQWIKYDTSSGILSALRELSPRRHTRNVIQPLVDTITGQIVSALPHLVTMPLSSEAADLYASEIASIVLETEVWKGLGMRENLLKIVPLLTIAGSVVLHPYYNPRLGKRYSKEELNQAGGYDEQNPNYKKEDVYEGRLEFDLLSEFEVSFDTSALDDKSRMWWSVSKVYSTDYIKETWNYEAKPTAPKNLRISTAYQRFLDTVEQKRVPKKLENSALVHKFWHKPCKDFPKGLFEVVLDNGEEIEEVFTSDLPWGLAECGELPFVKIDYKPMHGRAWGISPVTAARPIQKRINTFITQFEAFKARYMFPQLLVPTDSGITDEQFVNKPGEFVTFTPSMASERGGSPFYLQPPQFNWQFVEYMQMEKDAIAEIFGVNQFMTGSGGARTSGRGISLLQSAGEARISPVQVSLEEGLSRFGTLCLKIIQNTYTIPRLVSVVGDSKSSEINDFTGDMLRNNVNVSVELRSALPLNKQSAIDVVNTWWSTDFIPHDDNGREVAKKMLQLESFNPFFGDERKQHQAKFENGILDKGDKPEMVNEPIPDPITGELMENQVPKGLPRNEWDDDEVHLKVHEDRQRLISYLKLIEENPDVKVAYELHKAEHRQAIIEKEQLMAQTQMNSQLNMQEQTGQLQNQQEMDAMAQKMAMQGGGGNVYPEGMGGVEGEVSGQDQFGGLPQGV